MEYSWQTSKSAPGAKTKASERAQATTQPLLGFSSGCGFSSDSIWATIRSNTRLTFSPVRADVSTNEVSPQLAASAVPSSFVTCLSGDESRQFPPMRLDGTQETHRWTAKSLLLPTRTMGTFSRPV